MAWLLVIIAGALEIIWASGLKYASSTLEWIGVFALIAISFILLIQAYKRIPVAIAYTVFVGIGTVGTYAIGVYLGEPYSFAQILFLIILLTGIVGMKLSTTEKGETT
ncbi:multidrug efflux SMR transporter [Paenibacillus sp. SC116]|uniref:DMT family transporter n=1 Tax=Paenibacillus sp. SC116 TaxID=2968986 RepID=UPI00215B75CC|nr:multidrug efflux SMR transporter [Paenibacillus sp. SC116]MCR8844907.1 multidrug efflux SMR transporter [Paenibacillus sp. SC116]